jgi:hypothetical protein
MQQVQQSGLLASISGNTLWRWLHDDAVRPWYQRSWIFPRDPEFATKAGRVLDLYAREWQGCALKDDECHFGRRKEQHSGLPSKTPHPELWTTY